MLNINASVSLSKKDRGFIAFGETVFTGGKGNGSIWRSVWSSCFSKVAN